MLKRLNALTLEQWVAYTGKLPAWAIEVPIAIRSAALDELAKSSEMRSQIGGLPDVVIPVTATEQQKLEYARHSRSWKQIGLWIDYLQRLQVGYTRAVPPPANDEHDKILEAIGKYYFAVLQCLIAGWEKLGASQSGDARQLLAEICRIDANGDFSKCLEQTYIAETVRSVEEIEASRNSFMRLGFWRGDRQEPRLYSSDSLWLVPLRRARGSREKESFASAWKNLIKTHRELTRVLFRKKLPKETFRTDLTWNDGVAYCPRRGKPLVFKERNPQ